MTTPSIILPSPDYKPATDAKFKLLLKNAAQVVCVCVNKEKLKVGPQMKDVAIIENASVLVSQSGHIVAVGKESELSKLNWYREKCVEEIVDVTGKSIVPGFVDGHTHPVWSGDRVHEFALKIQGASYMEIHKAGGGIGFTVKHTRESSEKELLDLFLQRLNRMVSFGTTCVEAKSGYGLETGTELKMLRVIHQAEGKHPIKISATYLGGHSVPKDQTVANYTNNIINEQIPAILDAQAKGEVRVDNVDVFYEKGVFEKPETLKILQRGRECGWSINFHGDELHPMDSGELAVAVGARAISHLEEVSDADIARLAQHKISAVLLPTTAYVLRITPPPARKMIDNGVPVALGSDFNPNAHCLSMPHVMNLSSVLMRMTMEEALVAATINSAASLNLSDLHGSIEPGKLANFVIVDHIDYRHLIYEIADPPIESVYIQGNRVYKKK
ncbi:hypothetical protein BKA69DRAFT_1128162 [Paraphysoderma sedebokerense]|nr:hypothetical protein BKA69DRAFT_1128162 [Paraphysoderma sedebokerense]